MVILNKCSFSFIDSDCDSGLLVLVCSEGLALLGRNERSLWNDFGHDSSNGFNSEGKWGGVNNDDVLGGF